MENQVVVTNQNSVQAHSVSKTLKTGEEKFEIAIHGEKIINSPVENLKEVLRVAMLKLGIRGHNLPTEEEKYILLQHITENYGNHTAAEISLAFELAIAGKLDIDLNDVKAYENFSCLYFSTVMNAYRVWARVPNYKIEQEKRRLALPYEQREGLSDTEMKDWINEWKPKLKDLKNIPFLPVMFYDWLTLNGILKLSSEEKQEYFKQAIILEEGLVEEREKSENQFVRRNNEEWKRQLKNKEFSFGNKSMLQNLAKKISAFHYLNNEYNDSNV